MSKAIEQLIKLEDTIPNGRRFYEPEISEIEKELIFADTIKHKLERWLELLETDGIDSKNMVATDIQHILEKIKGE